MLSTLYIFAGKIRLPYFLEKSNENLILFNTYETSFGYLINEISFHSVDDISEINLFFLKREFDTIYPHLINEKI